MRCFPRKVGATWHVYFECRGTRYSSTLSTRDDKEADVRMGMVKDILYRIERGTLAIPDGADVKEFVLSGGARTKKAPKPNQAGAEQGTLGGVVDLYFKELTAGAKADGTLVTERIHTGHIRRILGDDAKPDLPLSAVQRYVDRRAKGTKDNPAVGRVTIEKEIATLGYIQRWAAKRGHASGPSWTVGDLTFPKRVERPPFQTMDQIKRRIERGGLSEDQAEALWECLWLDQEQTLDCLAWVEANAPRPWVHPAFAVAAYTGMRRGEILRSERDDWDLAGNVVHCRGRKSDASKSFAMRDVPIHPALKAVMEGWFGEHPGGTRAFADEGGGELTVNILSWTFRRTVDPGPWKVLHGWHVFRHSLASNLASEGADPRFINSIMGHADGSDMERRYRHLLPRRREKALGDLFRPAKLE